MTESSKIHPFWCSQICFESTISRWNTSYQNAALKNKYVSTFILFARSCTGTFRQLGAKGGIHKSKKIWGVTALQISFCLSCLVFLPHSPCKLLLAEKVYSWLLHTSHYSLTPPVFSPTVTGKHTEDAADGRGGETLTVFVLVDTKHNAMFSVALF